MKLQGRIQAFFGDDWEDTFDSIAAAPGALGGLSLAGLRQFRPIDLVAFALVLAGWAWIGGGVLVGGDDRLGLVALALLPTLLWLAAGVAGALIFEVAGLGKGSLAYWESYVLILIFALFGVLSLRLALSPAGRRVYRREPPSA
jgi:hypothetical protein